MNFILNPLHLSWKDYSETINTNELDSLLNRIFILSQQIFIDEHNMPIENKKTGGINPATNFEQWKNRLINNKGEIFYQLLEETQEVIAFIFACDRNYASDSQLINLIRDNSKDLETPQSKHLKHIWIAGCKASFRRLHLMKNLFGSLENYFLKPSSEVRLLTINTYPAHFPSMPRFLNHMNYQLIISSLEPEENSEAFIEKQTYIKFLKE